LTNNNQLEKLRIHWYESSPFPNLNTLTNLKKLRIIECSTLTLDDFQCFNSMSQLKKLVIENTPLPPELNFISPLVQLENLSIADMDAAKIEKMPPLNSLSSLKHLSIKNCSKLEDLSFLIFTPQVESLTIELFDAEQLSQLTHLKKLKNLEMINSFIDAEYSHSDLSTFIKENFKKLKTFKIIS